MKDQLQELDRLLQFNRTEFYSYLNPSLKASEIANLTQQYGLTIPEEVKNLYLWKDGPLLENFESFVNNSMFMSLEDLLQSYKELTSMIGKDFKLQNWWN